MGNEAIRKVFDAVINLKFKETKDVVEEALNAGAKPGDILIDGLTAAITKLSERYHKREVALPHLIVSTQMFEQAAGILKSHFAEGEAPRTAGKVVLGVVANDLHSIGKNLVKAMLKVSGYEVVDLGSDVSIENFMKAIRENSPDILALSALMTTTMQEMKETVKAVKEANPTLPVMVGGAPVTRSFADKIGAEGYALDCISAAEEAERIMG